LTLRCTTTENEELGKFRRCTGGATTGDIVKISGLSSPEGQVLNGLEGIVLAYDCKAERHRVKVSGGSIKRIKSNNLTVVPLTLVQAHIADIGTVDSKPTSRGCAPLDLCGEDVTVQKVIAASLLNHTPCDSDQSAPAVNAQVSDALLRNRDTHVAPYVYLLTYSRSPRAFRDALMHSPALAECRQALQDHGFQVELPTGAKVFEPPQLRPAVIEAIRLGGLQLTRVHVVVSPDLEDTVRHLIDAIPKKEKVYPRGSGPTRVPLGFAGAVARGDAPTLVSRTFIQVSLPSSMHSGSDSCMWTASTGDADNRKPDNPRTRGRFKFADRLHDA